MFVEPCYTAPANNATLNQAMLVLGRTTATIAGATRIVQAGIAKVYNCICWENCMCH